MLTTPLIRDADGTLQPASWSHAIVAAAQGLEAARGRTGVLVGGRGTWEDAYAYAKFARIVLDTNDIDFRARPYSAEEADFLAARVAGRPVTVSYSDLEIGAGGRAGRVRTGGRGADGVPAVAQGRPQERRCRCTRSPRSPLAR